MNSGKITDARDQVLTTRFSLRLFISPTRPRSRDSTNGPFLTDRDIAFSSPLRLAVPRPDDEPAGELGSPGPVAHRRLAPRGLRRHARRRLPFAATMRVVARGHRDTPCLRPEAHVAGAAGLAEALVLVVEVAHLAHGCHAADAHPAHLTRGQADLGEVAFLGEQLGCRT